MKTLRQILTNYCLANGWGTDDDELEETLRECFDVVAHTEDRPHRWCIEFDCVCKIEDEGCTRYFEYSSCKGTNDNSWSDAGYEFEGIDNVVEVFPKEVMVVKYVTKDKL